MEVGMIEKERRFNLKSGTKLKELITDAERSEILQGYFATEGNNHCRVRIQKCGDNLDCFVTLKSKTAEVGIREEYEVRIDFRTALQIMESSVCVTTKTRYETDAYIIDVFGKCNYIVVEIEDNKVVPDFCGIEITMVDTTYNMARLETRPKSKIISEFIKRLC